jgi:hypothetical protein
MSIREGIFCDVQNNVWGGGDGKENKKVFCVEIAVGRCAICDKDVCAIHALHPMKGISVSVELITTTVQGKLPSGLPNIVDYTIGEPLKQRIFVCNDCAGIRSIGTVENLAGKTAAFKKQIGEAIEESVVATLRGQLAAKVLDK